MRRAVVVALLLSVLTPTKASADAPVAWQHKALKVAQRVWHPAGGTFRIQWADRDAAGVDGRTVGWAFAGDFALYLPADKAWLGYPELCNVVLHEGGHAVGMVHSDRGIMRAESYISVTSTRVHGRKIERWSGVDRRCL